MILLIKRLTFRLFLVAAGLFICCVVTVSAQGRISQNFNDDWKFFKGDLAKAQNPDFDDSNWRQLVLPHDWSIEGPFSEEWASGTGYLPAGVGWYRKSFVIPESDRDCKIYIYFDGVYNNSEVWINGQYLGKRPNGHISFQYDLTSHLTFGNENILAVKVDHSRYADSRWYTGSGIYRDVKLIKTSKLHPKQWGVYVTTSSELAKVAMVDIEINLLNEFDVPKELMVANFLLFGNDTVGSSTNQIKMEASSEHILSQIIKVPKPNLWDVDNPNLYSLVTVLRQNDEIFDIQRTKIGFRSIRFDADKGFFLNKRNLKLKGICMHHDAGCLGVAVPRKVIARRLDILKEMGCNAIRTSHNPFSSDFIDLCDEKGFLVIDEMFDEWELPKKKWVKGWNVGEPAKDGYADDFGEWAKTDLRDFVLRDRNHPSIIMWSIGNEIDYPNDPYTHQILNTEANPQTWAKFNTKLPHANRLGQVAKELVDLIKKYDKSRPVTAGLASVLMSNETGYADALDVVGYNYQEFRYPGDHKKYPERIIYGSENGMAFNAWKAVAENDYLMGQFLWTGFEYLGEAHKFPRRHSTSGMIDLAGNKKTEFYFRQSLWSEKPMVFIGTSKPVTGDKKKNLWSHKKAAPTWNWKDGEKVVVSAFSNCEEVELLLNDRSIGRKKIADYEQKVINWEIHFEAGTLKAIARSKGKELASFHLKTAGNPEQLIAKSDVDKLKADSQDIAHILVEIADEKGIPVYSATNEVLCKIKGPLRLLGMEDSNPKNIENYKDNRQKAYHGRVLLYIQSLDKEGDAEVIVTSKGLKTAKYQLQIIR